MARDVVQSTQIFQVRYGAGARRGLALHCSLAHSGAWKGCFAALEEPIAIDAFDLPGHGKSSDWDGRSDYVALCRSVAEELIGEEPVDLIGHSGGAVAALQLALDRPDLVRTLTLIEPVLFAAARGTPEFDAWAEAMSPYVTALAKGARMEAAESFTRIWGTGTAWEEIEPRTRAYMADRIHLIAAGDPGLIEDNFGILAEGRLEMLDLPVMIIVGGDSPPVIGAIAEAIAARLPDVGLAEVPGAGHMLPITHPVQVAGLIDINLSRD
ncbi:alpha/beta hydrolase [Frigidibacter sp. RF13]|uniref:alpha/beta fold hydrolase n=1 Tax=Frigidibacter sp. RF13 TaxID=2997340 RepID=UPI002271915B|nr:alpha/beta hydrolase [Frigidibacter sp. RF13]MCY1127136.1 alpha/beta hydrolase [Frigidibacter sp. RF13]